MVVNGCAGRILRLGLILLLFLPLRDYLVLIDRPFGRIEQGHGYLPVPYLADDAAGRESLRQVLFAQAHGGKLCQPFLQGIVVDGRRVELLGDPAIQTDCLDLFQLTRPRTEGQPIERVQDTLVALNLFQLRRRRHFDRDRLRFWRILLGRKRWEGIAKLRQRQSTDQRPADSLCGKTLRSSLKSLRRMQDAPRHRNEPLQVRQVAGVNKYKIRQRSTSFHDSQRPAP